MANNTGLLITSISPETDEVVTVGQPKVKQQRSKHAHADTTSTNKRRPQPSKAQDDPKLEEELLLPTQSPHLQKRGNPKSRSSVQKGCTAKSSQKNALLR